MKFIKEQKAVKPVVDLIPKNTLIIGSTHLKKSLALKMDAKTSVCIK